MHKNCKFVSILLLLALMFNLFFPALSNADGCMFVPAIDKWMVSTEEKQMGLIHYENGVENLTLAIIINEKNIDASQLFWIFPVPSNPNNTSIDIIKKIDFYHSYQRDILTEVKSHITNFMLVMTAISQSHASVLPLLFYYFSGSIGGAGDEDLSDLEIYAHIEEMGLTTELISTISTDSLNNYLENKSIKLSDDALSVINDYIGSDYSFVVSWISDLKTFKFYAGLNSYNNQYTSGEKTYVMGVSVSFPTEKIYFPLKLTSIYKDQVIPVFIQINSYITPINTFDDMEIKYYGYETESYTEVEINTQSKEFTEDIWFQDQEPLTPKFAKFIMNILLIFSLMLFFFISILSGLFSSIIVFRKNQPIYWKFILLSLGNIFTIFFMFAICLRLKINETFVKNPVFVKSRISKNVNMIFLIIFLCSGLFCVCFFVTSILFKEFFLIFLFILFFLPVAIGILVFIYGSLRNEKVTAYMASFSFFFFIFLICLKIIFLS